MKILKHGNIELAIKKKVVFTCPKCNCIFEANNLEFSENFDCRNDYYYRSTCPECGGSCMKQNIFHQ